MKKSGFTLAEIIIALGIIGVVSALALPVLGNLIPDKDKIAVLNVNRLIIDINKEILNTTDWLTNSSIKGNDGEYVCSGLECLAAPDHVVVTPEQKKNPYLKLFTDNLQISGNVDYQSGRFDTKDGYQWYVTYNNSNYYITVDLMNGKEHKVYGESDCTKPGRFSFAVDIYGNVSGNDPLTVAYLADSKQMNNKKENYKTAQSDSANYNKNYTKVGKPTIIDPSQYKQNKTNVENIFKTIK